ncbi:UrcA family protein [Sphingomonas leidyi]|uniref:UrcA family protein n=1 Tax=Sphingomonas leidyi TaxID=68569 RepID=A0A7X5UZY5_9SPHN|nr:UrcA family protein [Sphingomonas leidyi]NIJ65273.1 UrcA family protein [Sphingomonas leidyi]
MPRFIAALAAATLLAVPALAEGRPERSATVRHADLDLNSAAGRAALDRRLAAATEQVCGSYAGADQDEAGRIQRCRATVERDVGRQLAARWGAARVARR